MHAACMVRGHPSGPVLWRSEHSTARTQGVDVVMFIEHSALGERTASCPGSWTIVHLEIMISLLGFRVTGLRFNSRSNTVSVKLRR
jgi:hypothetical protein